MWKPQRSEVWVPVARAQHTRVGAGAAAIATLSPESHMAPMPQTGENGDGERAVFPEGSASVRSETRSEAAVQRTGRHGALLVSAGFHVARPLPRSLRLGERLQPRAWETLSKKTVTARSRKRAEICKIYELCGVGTAEEVTLALNYARCQVTGQGRKLQRSSQEENCHESLPTAWVAGHSPTPTLPPSRALPVPVGSCFPHRKGPPRSKCFSRSSGRIWFRASFSWHHLHRCVGIAKPCGDGLRWAEPS